MKEIWKPIYGYEGYYEISNMGNVKTLKRKKYIPKNNSYGYIKERKLKPWKDSNGYMNIDLCKNKKSTRYKVHRLVAETFIDNPENLPFVNHIDFNTSNNKVENLEWVTARGNVMHSFSNGRISVPKNTKFPFKTVKEIRELYETGKYSQVALSERFGVSTNQVSRIVRYKTRLYE